MSEVEEGNKCFVGFLRIRSQKLFIPDEECLKMDKGPEFSKSTDIDVASANLSVGTDLIDNFEIRYKVLICGEK